MPILSRKNIISRLFRNIWKRKHKNFLKIMEQYLVVNESWKIIDIVTITSRIKIMLYHI